MVFNCYNKFEWKVLFDKLSFHSISVYKISWSEIVIQAYYRDENIPEEDWPSEDDDLILDLFENDCKTKPSDMFKSMYEGLLLSLGRFKYLMPEDISWFVIEQDDWSKNDIVEYLQNRLDDFFFDLCNYVVDLKLSSLIKYFNSNGQVYCKLSNNFDNFDDFFKLCGYMYYNSYDYFFNQSFWQYYNIYMTSTLNILKTVHKTYQNTIGNISVTYKSDLSTPNNYNW
jgi:hypothetical protein